GRVDLRKLEIGCRAQLALDAHQHTLPRGVSIRVLLRSALLNQQQPRAPAEPATQPTTPACSCGARYPTNNARNRMPTPPSNVVPGNSSARETSANPIFSCNL